ncbi:MAG: PadR family transcriptional regulator [Acidimicrobiia bacterium]|nr:PadR family transcriptional regulator [Acidimicrobiia bacterium]
MIELAVLGLLKEGSLHGYELKKRLRDVMGARSAVSFGSLYPALNRLERDGAVAAVAGERAAVAPDTPMTGSFAGEAAAFRASRRVATRGPRNKKVYGITPVGEARLAQLIADPADDERSFPVKVAFCRFTDEATRLRLLERRRATLVDRLGEGRRTIGARGDRLDRYVRSLLEHDSESTERDIAWLDRLLDDERSQHRDGDSPQATPVPPATEVDAPAPVAPSFPTHPFPTHPPSSTDGTNTAVQANGGSR